MDFLAISGDLWNLLILGMLPFLSVVMALIFIYKILAAAQITIPKWLHKTVKGTKRR
jgi:hypothetical protein